MYKTLLALSVVAIMVLTVSVSAGGKKEGKHMMMNMTCKGDKVDSKVFMTGKKECFAELFPSSGSTTAKPDSAEAKKEMMKKWMENALCLDVCFWKKQGILNADGTYNKEGSEKIVKAAFSAKVQADLKKAFDACAADNSKSLSTDNKCASYKGFKECKVKKFMEICEIKKPSEAS